MKDASTGGIQSHPLKTIYFYLTGGCNLQCRHCWIAPGYQKDGDAGTSLDLNLFQAILQQAKPLGLGGVKLTGGEPLLHPSIREILERIREMGLSLTVETNGVRCTPELAGLMASCKEAFVSVSLDGISAETHEWMRRVKGSFEAAVEGIRNAVQAGLHPQVIMTIVRRNRDEMEGMVRLAESLGAESVKFNIPQPTARGEKMHESGDTLEFEDFLELGRWVEGLLSASTRLRVHFSHPMAFRPLGRMFRPGGTRCGSCDILHILGVLADGSYALCGIGVSVQELVFGHASVDRLEDVWNGAPVLQELRVGLPQNLEGICGECLMKGVCLGSCMAQNYYRSGRLWAPNWYCQEARERGLFPDSRLHGELLHQEMEKTRRIGEEDREELKKGGKMRKGEEQEKTRRMDGEMERAL